MRLDLFKVGDNVYCTTGSGHAESHSTVRYIGSGFVVLAPSDGGQEFVLDETIEHFGDFDYYSGVADLREKRRRLEVLGRDLIAAIELSIPHHTPFLTHHMKVAIENFREELRRV